MENTMRSGIVDGAFRMPSGVCDFEPFRIVFSSEVEKRCSIWVYLGFLVAMDVRVSAFLMLLLGGEVERGGEKGAFSIDALNHTPCFFFCRRDYITDLKTICH